MLFACAFTLAPFLAGFFGMAELTPMLRIASLAILFNGMANPRMHVLQKEIGFSRWVALVEGPSIISVALAIGIAAFHDSVWPLVIAFGLCLLLLVILYRRLGWDRPERQIDLFRFKPIGKIFSTRLQPHLLRMPLLALTLLIMNNRREWVGEEFRNGVLANAVLVGTIAFFGYVGFIQAAEKIRMLFGP